VLTPILFAALFTAAFIERFGPAPEWAGPFEYGIAGIALASAAGLSLVSSLGWVRGRIALVIIGLAFPPAYAVAQWLGHGVEYAPDYPAHLQAALAGFFVLGAFGLLTRRLWAWWVACAVAGVGFCTCALNLAGTWDRADVVTWRYLIGVVGCGLIFIGLVRGGVPAFMSAGKKDSVWASRDPLVRSIRFAILGNLAAVPMLLVYAWDQAIVEPTRVPAIVAAFVLAGGLWLTAARKTVGALLLCAGGLGLLFITAVTVAVAFGDLDAREQEISLYYAVFWLPGSIAAMVAGSHVVRATVRHLSASRGA
jgi:hypothetical protein